MTLRDYRRVLRARDAGARHAYKIMQECRREDIPPDLAYALVEQESNFRNIFGCDHGYYTTVPFCRQKVTAERVAKLLDSPYSNGVGLTQLTYKPFVRQANRLGGAHKPRYQLRVGFRVLHGLIATYGIRGGCRRYNGSGDAAEAYADELLARRKKWNRILNP